MRISTSWAQQTAVNSMSDQQSRLLKTQMQISSGKKMLAPSDDPAAASRIIDLNQSIKQAEQYQTNSDAARQDLTLQGVALQSATNILQRVNELGIQGLNDTNSLSDRGAIASEMESLNQELIGIANTKNASGEYLFSGFKSTTEPFSKNTAGGYNYAGDSMQRTIQIGENRQITSGDPGVNVFGATTNSLPTAGSNTNIFEALDRFAADLKGNSPNAASLDDISSALDKVLAVQASNGVRLNALDSQDEFNADFVLNTKTVLSATEDLDYASAIGKFNLQTVSLQAAQQAFTQVKKLSLFNYL